MPDGYIASSILDATFTRSAPHASSGPSSRKLDRLTQSVRDLAELIELCAKHEVALVSIGEALEPRIGSQSQLEFPTGSAARFF